MSKNIDVGVNITANSKGLVNESRAAKEAIGGLGDATRRAGADAQNYSGQTDRQAASLATLKTGLINAAGAYLSFAAAMAGGKAIVDAALANERLANTLKVATGSAEAAARETAFLRQESEKLGLQFATTSQQYAKLSAAAAGTALQGQATRDIFLGIAKASTVLGLSADQTGGALLAIEQMISKGNVSAEELRGQLGERLPGAFQIAARAMGVTTQELDKMLVKGEITATRLLPALAAELEKTFGAQAQEAAQGLNAKINRLDNAFTDLKTAIGNTGLLELLSSGIELATRFTNALSGAKVLSAVDQQTQKIAALRAELERKQGINGILPVFYNKKDFDLLEQQIDDGVADLARLEKAARDASEAVSGKKAITPGSKPALPDELVKERENAAKASKQAADARAREAAQALQSSQKIIESFKRETAEIGLNVIQKKMLSAAAEAAKAPNKELAQQIMANAQAWGLATQKQEDLQAAEKQRIRGLEAIEAAEKEAARASQDAARRSAAEWNRLWGGVEQTAKMAFVQFAAHGRSAMESIGESIKIAIMDVLYQLTLRKWVINIGTSLEEAFINNAAGNAGGSLNSVLKGASIGNLFGMNPTQLAAQKGAMSLWGATGTGSNLMTSLLSPSASGVAGALGVLGASVGIGSTLAGDKKVLGLNGMTTSIIGAALGGPIGAVVGGAINALFGHGPMKFRQQVAIGTANSDGFDGRVTDVFRAKGGLLVGNKHKEQSASNEDELIRIFDDTIKGFSKGAREFADTLGLNTDSITGYSKTIRLESEKGKALTEEAIKAMLTGIGDDFAKGLVPQIDALRKSGESAFDALTRLNAEFVTLVDVGAALGHTLSGARDFIKNASFAQRSAFLEDAGGAEALMNNAKMFSDNFLTVEERLRPAQEGLNEQLGKLGLSTELTRDQFKSLAQSFGNVGGVSEEVFLGLMRLVPAFLEVRNAQDELAKSSGQTAEALRKIEALDNLGSAYADLEKSVGRERDGATNRYNDALKTVNERIQTLNGSVNKLKALSDAVKATLEAVRPISRDEAKQQLRDAISGKFPLDLENLRGALGSVSQISLKDFGSTFDFEEERRRTANLVDQLRGKTDSALTSEEQMLKAAEDQRELLEQGYKEEMKRLDALLEQAKNQVDAANGIKTAILTLVDAIGQFNLGAIQAGTGTIGNGAVSGNPQISNQQIRDFANAPGRTDREIYDAAKENGVSFVQFAAATGKNVEDLYAWARKNNLKAFASGGMHSGGLRIVGERGPELEFTGPSRIASNQDFKNLLKSDELSNDIKELTKQFKKVVMFTKNTSNKLDQVTRNGTAIRTKGIA